MRTSLKVCIPMALTGAHVPELVCMSPEPKKKTKPAVPYMQGTVLTLYRHTPPQRTSDGYSVFSCEDMEEMQRLSHLQRCLLHSPLPGKDPGGNPTTVIVTNEIAVRDGRGAQVVTVNDNMVAKIYDPLYYPVPTLQNDVEREPIRAADEDYSHEALVYETVGEKLGGTVVPKYYGSYTCKLLVSKPGDSSNKGRTRSVRVILMELVQGECMRDVDHIRREFTQAERKYIMSQVVDGESILYGFGICQLDLHPRNFMLQRGTDAGEIRVILIDFERTESTPLEDCLYTETGHSRSVFPVSPLLRWEVRQDYHADFEDYGWIDWDWQAWLEKTWGESTSYRTVTPDLEDEWLGIYKEPLTTVQSWQTNESID